MINRIRNLFKKLPNSQSGFSLVEIMTAMIIFGVVMSIVAQIFVMGVKIQRRAYSAQKVQENSLYVLETIAREVRVSAISSPEFDCSLGTYGNSLTIAHPVNGTVTYSLDVATGMVQRTENSVYTGNVDQSVFLSSRDVKFNDLHFCVFGASNGVADGSQARVAIVIDVESADSPEDVHVQLQTTVSQRDLFPEL